MLAHLDIAYYYTASIIGFAAMIILAYVWRKIRSTLFAKLLVVLFLSSLSLVASLLNDYLLVNTPGEGLRIRYFLYLVDILGSIWIIFFLPLLVHDLFPEKRNRIMDRGFLACSIFLTLNVFFLRDVSFATGRIVYGGSGPQYIVHFFLLVAALAYSILLTMRRFRGIADFPKQQLVRLILLVGGASSPAIVLDILRDKTFENLGLSLQLGDFRFVPLFYSALSIAIAVASLRFYRWHIQSQKHLTPSPNSVSRFGISDREEEVLALVLKGYGNQRISEELFISGSTVKKHVASLLKKTDSRTRWELLGKTTG